MKIQLIHGQFSAKDAIEIISQMVHIKIKFQEDKIHDSSSEEEIKMRETRIKQLQNDLFNMRKFVEKNGATINVESEVQLSS